MKTGILWLAFRYSIYSKEELVEKDDVELSRKHKAAATTVIGLLVAIILLSLVAYLGRPYFRQQSNPPLNMAVRIVVLMLGLGAVVWRRTKFAEMRLQDIHALQGNTGLLRTLEITSLQVAFFGAAIVVVGFIATVMTGSDEYTYWSGVIAILLLLWYFPTKTSWKRTLAYFANKNAPDGETPKNSEAQ